MHSDSGERNEKLMFSPDWSHSSAAGLGAQSRGGGRQGLAAVPRALQVGSALLSVQGGLCSLNSWHGCLLEEVLEYSWATPPQQMILDLLQSPVSSDK